MRIDSATVGMESARSYSAVSFSFKRFAEMDFSGALSANTSLGDGALFKNEEPSEEKGEKNTGNMITKDGIMDLRERIEGLKKNYKIRTYDEKTAEQIKHESIMYILDLLFGDAKERIRKRLEERMRGQTGADAGTAYTDTNTANSDGTILDNAVSGDGTAIEGNNAGLSNAQAADLLTADPAKLLTMPVKRLMYQSVDRYEEYEDTKFSSMGTVRTADGREINFNIDVSMSRRFVQETSINLGIDMIKTCDPLVINLDGNIANVSDQKIRFDIDGDGELDTVNRLNSRSGYLSLDLNGDGKINDGTELFGTKSGDGFADLAKYDRDHNGWIDENDAIWDKLKIWVTDEYGHEQLYSLSEAGIGALCLAKAATEFADTNENNDKKAFVRSTGIFLYENGMAGTMQHLDLVKYQQEA